MERLLKQIDLNADDGIAYDEWMAAMLTWRTVRLHDARASFHMRCPPLYVLCVHVDMCSDANAAEVGVG